MPLNVFIPFEDLLLKYKIRYLIHGSSSDDFVKNLIEDINMKNLQEKKTNYEVIVGVKYTNAVSEKHFKIKTKK